MSSDTDEQNGEFDPMFSNSEPEDAESSDESDESEQSHIDLSPIGAAIGKALTTIPKPMFGIRSRMFKAMVKGGLKNYHKTSGADAIAFNGKPGQQVEILPVKYRAPEEVEDAGGRPGWKAKGRDKIWNPGTEGNSVNYLGKTPTVLLQDDDHVEAGWLAPRIGEAIDLDNYSPLFVGNQFDVTVDYGSAARGASSNGALADGGNPSRIDFDLQSLGEWAGDNVIDLDSGENYQGMRISTAKAREWRAEKSDSEHMQMQEDRGYLRGLANGDSGPGMIKMLLICGAIILGVLAIVLLGPELVGGSGEQVSGALFYSLLGG